jgi:opacity protein-like surface antigen
MNAAMRIASAFALAAALSVPATAHAQRANFSVSGGVSLANGAFGRRNDAGYAIGVGLGIAQAGSPLSFRVDGIYSQFNKKNFFDAKTQARGVIASALYDFGVKGAAFTPYAIGGVGRYSTKEALAASVTIGQPPAIFYESDTNVGWSLGAGIRFPLSGFSAYVESRYNSVSNAPAGVAFAPVVFGLRF